MSLETDSLTFAHLVQHLSGVGTRTCALFALGVRTAAIKLRWCLHLGWMKADVVFFVSFVVVVILTARVGLLNWWKTKKERKNGDSFKLKTLSCIFFPAQPWLRTQHKHPKYTPVYSGTAQPFYKALKKKNNNNDETVELFENVINK